MKRWLFLMMLVFVSVVVSAQVDSTQKHFDQFIAYSSQQGFKQRSTADKMVTIGRYFLGAPYKGATLEADGPERLQVNFSVFDCTTFVETVLALSMTTSGDDTSFDAYKRNLTRIRYRDGLLNAYPSRLHYTSDWIFNNRQKGLIQLVNLGDSARPFPVHVGFMSTHPASYPALNAHPEFIPTIAAQESAINSRSIPYLPKELVNQVVDSIHPGDIITITTGVAGLDYSHLGIAVKDANGRLYLMHASSTAGKVIISDQPLYDYLMSVKRHTGITVVRPQ